jgi:hypothetical protein
MSMHGSTNAISPAAREALFNALGDDNPVIVVDDLKGDARKGEPITSGVLSVIDRSCAQHGGVVNERCVVIHGSLVVYTVLVAKTDELTHAKAEKALRSLATLTGIQVRPPRERAPKPEDIDEDPAPLARVVCDDCRGVLTVPRIESGLGEVKCPDCEADVVYEAHEQFYPKGQ